LATLNNKYYRMSIRWLHDHKIIDLEINDYVKVTKTSHELIRRMGVDWS